MDTEIIVSVAQILTGAAPLIFAVFLTGQLVLQRKVLTRAHNDAEIELSLNSNSFWKDLSVLKVLSEPLRKAYLKRDQDFFRCQKKIQTFSLNITSRCIHFLIWSGV